MSGPMQNMVVSLVLMQVARKIPFDDPQVLNYVRIAYVTAQAIILGTYFFTAQKIKSKNDQTVLKYVDAPNAMTQEPGALVTTTVRDYDLTQVSQLLRSAYIGLAMMAGMHLYMKWTQPLFMQAVMGLKGIYDAKEVHIHLLGQPATGDFQRPFKAAPSPFGGAAAGPATDAASIAEAEKRVGKKVE